MKLSDVLARLVFEES